MSESTKLSDPSAWVPQLFFDLIGRVIPGSILILLAIAMKLAPNLDALVSKPLIDRGFAASFLSLSCVLVVGTFASYALAVIIWGLWFWLSYGFSWTSKWRFEPETLVGRKPEEVAKRYEKVKAADPSASGRITKLKAEIHMCTTLIMGLMLLIAWEVFTTNRTCWWAPMLFGILGATGALLHFRRRIKYILDLYSATQKT